MNFQPLFKISLIALLATFSTAEAAPSSVDQLAEELEPRVIKWRRHFHQNPELSNREFNTSKTIAEHLKKLGLKVTTGIAHTGVVAILDSGKPGPVIALRADIDGYL